LRGPRFVLTGGAGFIGKYLPGDLIPVICAFFVRRILVGLAGVSQEILATNSVHVEAGRGWNGARGGSMDFM